MKEKFLFIGGIASEEQLKRMEKVYAHRPVFSSDPLQTSIIQGLSEKIGAKIDVFNLVFYPTPPKKFYSAAEIHETSYAVFHNIPFTCGRIIQHFSKKRNLLKNLRQLPNEKLHIVVYSAYFPFLQALWKFKKQRSNIDICLVVPDLPQYQGLNSQKSFYRFLSTKVSRMLFDKYNSCVDSYVLLTEQMKDVVNPYAKKYVVIEGIAPSEYIFAKNTSITNNIIYSGTLQFKYGIGILLEAATLIDNVSIRFLFYGDGEAKNAIIEASKTDPRIEYHPPVGRDELHKIQQGAKLLINPRQNIGEFTKYSFPSKNIEYLLSGRPVVAYKLEGIPDEYDNFLNYPENNSPQALADKITELCNKPEEAMSAEGIKGRSFVLKEKNYNIQTQKIWGMITNAQRECEGLEGDKV